VCVLLHISNIRIADQNFRTNIFVLRPPPSEIRTQDASLQEGVQGYITVSGS
jgi:hypothetical protein